MIEILGSYLVVFDSGFDVLRYLTVRTIGGTITALFLSIFLGPIIIKYLNLFNIHSPLEMMALSHIYLRPELQLWGD